MITHSCDVISTTEFCFFWGGGGGREEEGGTRKKFLTHATRNLKSRSQSLRNIKISYLNPNMELSIAYARNKRVNKLI